MDWPHRHDVYTNSSLMMACRKLGRTDVGFILPKHFKAGLLPIIEREMNERALRVHSFDS